MKAFWIALAVGVVLLGALLIPSQVSRCQKEKREAEKWEARMKESKEESDRVTKEVDEFLEKEKRSLGE